MSHRGGSEEVSQYKFDSSTVYISASQTQDPLYFPYFSSTSVRMVNFRDPNVIAMDSRAYSFELHLETDGIMIGFFESCNFKALAPCEWPLYVGLLAPIFSFYRILLTRRVILQLGVLHDSRF